MQCFFHWKKAGSLFFFFLDRKGMAIYRKEKQKFVDDDWIFKFCISFAQQFFFVKAFVTQLLSIFGTSPSFIVSLHCAKAEMALLSHFSKENNNDKTKGE